MGLIINYLGSGKIYHKNRKLVVTLTVYKLENINKIFIPLFKFYPLHV
jgi:hypothetical protein